MAAKLLNLIAEKTAECEKLAEVIEESREPGKDPNKPQLQAAEHNLAVRYAEVKELAAIAEKLGVQPDAAPDAQNEALVVAEPTETALRNVSHLEQELYHCSQQLRMIDGSTSEAVARHPAFLRMRATVEQKMESLHEQLSEARQGNNEDSMLGEEREEMDLAPMLKASLDNLWQRPYDCRVFLLQLLQALADLDDRSVCMMSSCFARYLETHSAPAR